MLNLQFFSHVYPNLLVNRFGEWMDANYILPVAADRCEVVTDVFLEETAASTRSPEELEK
jgi:hypothetical protein